MNRDWTDWWMRTALAPWLRETSTGTDTAGALPTGSFAPRQSEMRATINSHV